MTVTALSQPCFMMLNVAEKEAFIFLNVCSLISCIFSTRTFSSIEKSSVLLIISEVIPMQNSVADALIFSNSTDSSSTRIPVLSRPSAATSMDFNGSPSFSRSMLREASKLELIIVSISLILLSSFSWSVLIFSRKVAAFLWVICSILFFMSVFVGILSVCGRGEKELRSCFVIIVWESFMLSVNWEILSRRRSVRFL